MKALPPWLPPVLTALALLLAWYAGLALGWFRPYLLPSPHAILEALWVRREALLLAGGRTFFAAFLGFLAAAAGGFGLSLLLASHRWLRQALHPYVLALQMTPIIVLVPIIQIWVEDALLRLVLITFLISFFPVVANTTHGFLSTDRNLRDLFQVYGATPRQELFLLRLPFALPFFLTGLKIAGTLAPIGAITGDFMVGTSTSAGFGYLLLTYQSQAQIPAVYAIALVACGFGFVFVATVHTLHFFLLRRWHESARPHPPEAPLP